MAVEPSTVTTVLRQAARGDRQAADELLPLLYDELHRYAQAMMRKLPPGQTLQPTALLHEAWRKLVEPGDPGWDGKGHFWAAAARAMRNIIVDRCRRKNAAKHGGGLVRFELADFDLVQKPTDDDVLALHEALERLQADDPRKGQIVEMRYFAGLKDAEIAQLLGIHVGTVERDLRFSKAWLRVQLTDPHSKDPDER